MRAAKETKAPDTAIYSMEAYYSMPNSLFPMSSFASELLEAKSEAEIIQICIKYDFDHTTFDKHTQSHLYAVSNREDHWPAGSSESPLSFPSWLFEHMKTISATLQLYTVCLPVARRKSQNSDTENLFEMLHYALKLHQQIMAEIHHTYGWIADERSRINRMRYAQLHMLKLPLVSLFDAFQCEEGYWLQAHYGHNFKQMRRRGDSSPPRSQFHYWQNPAAAEEARDKLWEYACNHQEDDCRYVLKWQTKELAEVYLHILDRYISDGLGSIRLELDSKIGTAKLVTGGGLESALNLWLFTQIQAQTDYRICKMCGRLYIPGTQKGKKYCNLHEKHEINYYNRTIRRQGASADSDENE